MLPAWCAILSNELTLDQLQDLHNYQLPVVTVKVVSERDDEWPEETQLHSDAISTATVTL